MTVEREVGDLSQVEPVQRGGQNDQAFGVVAPHGGEGVAEVRGAVDRARYQRQISRRRCTSQRVHLRLGAGVARLPEHGDRRSVGTASRRSPSRRGVSAGASSAASRPSAIGST